MDRLKPLDFFSPRQVGRYLHSNMDRLKPAGAGSRQRRRVIYIPIWID